MIKLQKMNREHYHRLGDYIQLVDVRNRELAVTKLLGVSISKTFIPSIANTIGTDMSTYKIVEPYQFAYGPVTSRNGDKITFALYKGEEKCIVSSAYVTFDIIDKEKLDPDYLMMWALRPEFDRYARFMSNGSAREIFSWEDMCDVYLPVPDIDTQRRIVAEYQAVQTRFATNKRLVEKLEETAQALYKKMFIDDVDIESLPKDWHLGSFDEVASVSSGKTLTDKRDTFEGNYIYPVAGASGVIGYSRVFNQETPFLTTGRVGTIGVVNKYKSKSWTADNVLVITSDYYEFSYQILKSIRYEDIMKGGVQSLITQTDLKNAPIVVPSSDALNEFEEKANKIDKAVEATIIENNLLSGLSSLLLEKMSKV